MKAKRSGVLILGLVLSLAFVAPLVASADWTINLGDDGWNPTHTQHYDYRKIEFFIPDVPANAGITWSGNGVSGFSNTGWTANAINPTYVLATGPKVTDTMLWNAIFTGQTAPANFQLDYLIYSRTQDSTPAFGLSLYIRNGQLNLTQGIGWTTIDPSQYSSYNRTAAAVPVPPTILLLGAGVAGVIILRKRIQG